MIYAAIAFFSLAAILGMLLLSYVLRDKETPKGIVFTHGPLAAIGIVLLIVYALGNTPSPVESIVLFIIAAAGGTILVWHDVKRKPIPKWLAVTHGLIAVTAFVFLLYFAFK
ncbi:MAG: hypothetical protein EHM58_07870 [Ignavibacteriae bacterium]|nr:MAG: hypothetical protein EHM58_07870 [Ignavibacteriota bacterium]